jgi:hypothetical protein
MTMAAFKAHVREEGYTPAKLALLKKERRRYLNRQYQCKSSLKPTTKSYKKAHKKARPGNATHPSKVATASSPPSTPQQPISTVALAAKATPASMGLDDDATSQASFGAAAMDTMDTGYEEESLVTPSPFSSARVTPLLPSIAPLLGLDLFPLDSQVCDKEDNLDFLVRSAVHSTVHSCCFVLNSPPPNELHSSLPPVPMDDDSDLTELASYTSLHHDGLDDGLDAFETTISSSLPESLGL